MPFEWDEDKRQANLAKHDIDFIRARLLFDGRPIVSSRSSSTAEEQWLATGLIDGRFVTVVWTPRGAAIRIISARSARDAETRNYRALHGGGA